MSQDRLFAPAAGPGASSAALRPSPMPPARATTSRVASVRRALFFGESSSPLFGVVDEPVSDIARECGVLLCPPIGQEHVRTHWALRQAAASLSRSGFPCLRFDWYGVGDSPGDLLSATLERWLDDVHTAAEELRDATGVRRVALFGVRFGATLAALAAREMKPSRLLLWDPVPNGQTYLRQLRDLQRAALADPNRYWTHTVVRGARSEGELLGFDVGASLLREIEGIGPEDLAQLPVERIDMVLSSDIEGLEPFDEALRSRGIGVRVRRARVAARWTSASQLEELLLPADLLSTVTDLLGTESP